LNILHVIESLDPAAGGTAVVAARLAEAQAKLGHTVAVLAMPSGKQLTINGVTIAAAPPISRLQALLGQEVSEVSGYDIVHMHGVWDPLLYAAARTARRRHIPYVVTPHGMLDPWSLQQSRWKKKLALALGWRGMLNRAAAIHWLNADEEKLAANVGVTAPGVVIPNGVNLEDFSHLPPVSDRGLSTQPYILFLSRLHYKKGLDFLADAFRIVAAKRPDVRLVVAGPDDGARGEFEQRIAAAGLSERVRLPGPIYGPEKLATLAGAACFVLPSRQEGFSVAILEAMACGTPAVVSTECHFPEVAEAGAGEVVPLETNAIAGALDRVLGDPTLRERMGKSGRELVAARFTWPRIAERSVDVYDRLIQGTK
jgi:glycosyltransferase involved in cell wall biosynthesis